MKDFCPPAVGLKCGIKMVLKPHFQPGGLL